MNSRYLSPPATRITALTYAHVICYLPPSTHLCTQTPSHTRRCPDVRSRYLPPSTHLSALALSRAHRCPDVLNAIVLEARELHVRADLERLRGHAPLDVLHQGLLNLSRECEQQRLGVRGRLQENQKEYPCHMMSSTKAF